MTQGDRLRVYAIYSHVFYGNMQFHSPCNLAAGVNGVITG
jgi:hypothetical protein